MQLYGSKALAQPIASYYIGARTLHLHLLKFEHRRIQWHSSVYVLIDGRLKRCLVRRITIPLETPTLESAKSYAYSRSSLATFLAAVAPHSLPPVLAAYLPDGLVHPCLIGNRSSRGLRTHCHSPPRANLAGRQKNRRNEWREVNNTIGAGPHYHDPVRQYFYVLLKL